MTLTCIVEEDPASFQDAMASIDSLFQKEAINSERDSILANQNMDLSPLL